VLARYAAGSSGNPGSRGFVASVNSQEIATETPAVSVSLMGTARTVRLRRSNSLAAAISSGSSGYFPGGGGRAISSANPRAHRIAHRSVILCSLFSRARAVVRRAVHDGGYHGSTTAWRYRQRSSVYAGRGGFLRGIPKPVMITGIRLLPIKRPFSFIATSI
jgi:hypothetical protein